MIFAFKSYLYDIRRELRYLLKSDDYSQERYLAKILLRNHIIEKGLSMHSFRPGFGRDNLFSLVGLCSDYAAGGYDTGEPVFRSTVALLKEYKRVHQEAGYNLDADIIKLIDGFTAGKGTTPMLFPDGMQSLNSPYVEAGVGLTNILNLIRVDFMWRLTHRETARRNFVVVFGVDFKF